MAHGLDVHCSSVLHVECNIIIIYHYDDDKKKKSAIIILLKICYMCIITHTHTHNMPAGFYKLHSG